jgi:hypothetical protein
MLKRVGWRIWVSEQFGFIAMESKAVSGARGSRSVLRLPICLGHREGARVASQQSPVFRTRRERYTRSI